MAEHILVVEDENITRRSICDVLRNEGYQVTDASDGAQALGLLNEQTFDLVVLDFIIPKIHGLHLVDRIHARWRHTPAIVISGYLSKAAGESILAGLADFIAKPIDPATLLSRVRNKLRKRD